MKKSKYSLSAFFLTFMYYMMVGEYRKGIASAVCVAVLPLKYYFIIGFVVGFYTSPEDRVTLKGALIGIVTLFIVCFIKTLFLVIMKG